MGLKGFALDCFLTGFITGMIFAILYFMDELISVPLPYEGILLIIVLIIGDVWFILSMYRSYKRLKL